MRFSRVEDGFVEFNVVRPATWFLTIHFLLFFFGPVFPQVEFDMSKLAPDEFEDILSLIHSHSGTKDIKDYVTGWSWMTICRASCELKPFWQVRKFASLGHTSAAHTPLTAKFVHGASCSLLMGYSWSLYLAQTSNIRMIRTVSSLSTIPSADDRPSPMIPKPKSCASYTACGCCIYVGHKLWCLWCA